MNKLNLEDNIIYEVLITTKSNNTYHTKPFGVQFRDNKVILNLYPNNTISNLKNNGQFIIEITNNPLLFTKATLNKLDGTDYNKGHLCDSSVVIKASVESIDTKKISNKYGISTLFSVIASIKDYEILDSKPPIISRATNKIIDLLIDYTRLEFFNQKQLNNYYKNLEDTALFINKTGNDLHKISIELLKESK